MAGLAVSFLVGVVCLVIGIANRKGNISMLHSYHTHRVAEEDRLPLSKKVGLGMILVGAAIMAHSAVSAVALLTGKEALVLVATGLLIVGLIIGLGITLGAIIKYNKGLF